MISEYEKNFTKRSVHYISLESSIRERTFSIDYKLYRNSQLKYFFLFLYKYIDFCLSVIGSSAIHGEIV